MPQRLSLASAALTWELSGTTGRSSQSVRSPLLITRPLSSTSTPVAPLPTRLWAAWITCWTRSSFERERSMPTTAPPSPRTGTEW